MKNTVTRIILVVLGLFTGNTAMAQVTYDLEVDPLAYMLEGHSVHLGISGDYGRMDLGVFGLKVSEDLLGKQGFEAEFTGAGIKLDAQKATEAGLFYGIEASRNKVDYRHLSTDTTITQYETNYGVRAGYRMITGNVTFSPWVGIGKNMEQAEISVGEDTLEKPKITVFPTLHVGYNF